ncbi:NF-kappa-B inhibitor cactus [Drosophila teissieri]|uniref:NF-kappa-B inhibitor cactus n=1 Tax=Drosophila teissieri TaxID=7243 RepID=UPI001CB9DEBB|nr:NF-kappa-B inhibitor cactus [Drosophila teissieri]
MPSPTKAAEAATKATATSDCSCSAASVEQRGPANAANPSSPLATSGKIGGKTQDQTAAINKPKEFAVPNETSDSGFISGPQSSQIFSEEIVSDIEEQDKDQQQSAPQKEQPVVLDSGIIDEEEDQEQDTTTATADSMRLKHSADTGIPQWTVESHLVNRGEQLNNLGQSSSTQITGRSKVQSSTASTANANPSGSGATSSAPPSSINILNAWEQFYQQNDDGDTPLHLACISGSVEVVAALIRMAPHPCLLNIQNDVAQTPLHLAALTAQPNIMRILLLAGAEPAVRDRHGNTALHLSCIAGEKQCVRALTEEFGATEIHEAHRQYGHRSNDKAVSSLSYARLPADLEIRNYNGERCVHLAAEAGHIDILRILVSHGADINAREGKSGRTPLHIAIEGCNEDLANFLLDECEKLNLETATYAGLTAYQFACIMNKSRMQNILEKRGAETVTPPDSDYDSSDIEDLDDTKMYDRFGDPRYFVSYNGGNPMTVA